VKIGVAADDQEFSGIGAANRDFAWAAFIHPPNVSKRARLTDKTAPPVIAHGLGDKHLPGID